MRLFCAVTPTPRWIELLGKVQRDLKPLYGDAVRWVDPPLAHLTVRFIGEVGDIETEKLITLWRSVILPPQPIVLELTTCGCFPEEGPERVLWMGAEARSGSWSELVSYCDTVLSQVGITLSEVDPVAHMTIGRVKVPSKVRGLRHHLSRISLSEEPLLVSSVDLFRSTPTPHGSHYELLAVTFNAP
jgi:2'-5' RNA ligase